MNTTNHDDYEKAPPTTPAQEGVLLALYVLIDAAATLVFGGPEEDDLDSESGSFYWDTYHILHFSRLLEGCLSSTILLTPAIRERSHRSHEHLAEQRRAQKERETREEDEDESTGETASSPPAPIACVTAAARLKKHYWEPD